MDHGDLPDFGYDLSSFIDHENDGQRAAELLEMPLVTAASYDPATRRITLTLRGEALLYPAEVEGEMSL